MAELIGIDYPELIIAALLLICYWILLKLSAKAFCKFEKKKRHLPKARGHEFDH